MKDRTEINARGRGAQIRPPNRFEKLTFEEEDEYLEFDEGAVEAKKNLRTEYYPDQTQSIVASNDSPDIPFRYSINPYRGCAHGCSYCYARPYHEYLGFNAGLDFETKVMVKENAALLFRNWLCRKSWRSEPIAFSGVTDCYQPIERRFQLTRQCLDIASKAKQAVMIITKNGLITRDCDILAEMAHDDLVSVAVSVTSLNQSLIRDMEPRTSCPEARLQAISSLAECGIPTQVMVGPVIPGLTDVEIPRILEAASQAGATSASFVVLRLPLSVKPIFIDWLDRNYPDRKEKVLSSIRETRDGKLNSTEFGNRMRGEGVIAENIRQMFRIFRAKHGLNSGPHPLDCSKFRPPNSSRQLDLF